MFSCLKHLVSMISIFFFASCSQIEPEESKPTGFEIVSNPHLLTEETPKNFKVAFVGDTGTGYGFERVLHLIKEQKADMILHLGDFAYGYDQEAGAKMWLETLSKVFDENFPYFFLVGNHEKLGWSHYVDIFYERLKKLPERTCYVANDKSDLGVKSYCVYKGIFFLLSGVGTLGVNHNNFIETALRTYQNRLWKVCAWHKNQASLQLGTKVDEVGWKPYELCQKYGAFIAMGHEHSYGRTKTLTKIGNEFLWHGAKGDPESVTLEPGKTFSAVVGTGGKSLRPYNCAKGSLAPWWASVYTANYSVKNRKDVDWLNCFDNDSKRDQEKTEFGAMFVTFNYDGQENKARGEFITTSGRVIDDFMIEGK